MELEYTADVVRLRLQEAGRTLLSMPGSGCFPAGYRNNWPQVVHAALDAYREEEIDQPGARDVTRMDEALRWIAFIPLQPGRQGSGETWSRHGGALVRRVVMMRSLINPRTGREIWSARRIGEALGTSHTQVGRWYDQGIDRIVVALNRVGLCAASGGCVLGKSAHLPLAGIAARRVPA
jgi:hypothetical protein